MNIDVLSLLMGIIIGIGITAGAVVLKSYGPARVIYRTRPWRRR
jgi:hypothetical protein